MHHGDVTGSLLKLREMDFAGVSRSTARLWVYLEPSCSKVSEL